MNDYISRQAAIETVRKCAVKEVTPAYMLIDKAEAMTELMMLPSAQPDCTDCIKHGGDWECDYNTCHKGMDTISRQTAIDAVEKTKEVAR